MAQSIRSSDFLAICFYFSGSNMDKDIARVITNVESYMHENSCWLGTGQYDFRNALFWLTSDNGFFDIGQYERLPEIMKNIRLRDVIIPILNTRQLYCNDEGEYWEGNASSDSNENWSDDYANPADIEYEQEIRCFFTSPAKITNKHAKAFFTEHINIEQLKHKYFNKS